MSGTGESKAYRSSSPAVLDAWAAWRAERSGFSEQAKRFALEHAEGRDTFASSWANETRIVGVAAGGGPIAGWRQHPRFDNVLIPDKRTKVGKAAASAMGLLKFEDPRLPGMPSAIMQTPFNGMIRTPRRIFEWEGVVYVQWSVEADVEGGASASWVRDQDPYDPRAWEPCPLSAFYAAVEASEAAR